MSLTRYFRSAVLTVSVVLAAGATHVQAASPPAPEPSVIAFFEGRWIALADGWGEAHACYSDIVSTRCYRTEAEMDAAESSERLAAVSPQVACGSTVKLYRLGSYGGDVLELATRGVYIGLSPYGFDNDTSSYKIGACTSRFYDVSPATTQYPGTTTAGTLSPGMSSGWDNRVSSVYIT